MPGEALGALGDRSGARQPASFDHTKINPEIIKIFNFWINFWITREFVNYIEISLHKVFIWAPDPALVNYRQILTHRFFYFSNSER